MAIGDQVGKVAVDEVNSTTLPEAAKIITDTLTQAAVIVNGALNGIEGERLLAMQGLADMFRGTINPMIDPLLAQWVRTNNALERYATILERLNISVPKQ